MESHEVPKNISEFEFHLVGDMTIKQFAYLATGLGLAYILFVFLGSSAPVLAYPLMLIFGLTGVAFAFLPISERPLDHWSTSFFKAIFNPTKRAWKFNSFDTSSPLFNNRLNVFLSTIPDKEFLSQPKPTVLSKFIAHQTPVSPPSAPKPVAQPVIPQQPPAPIPKPMERQAPPSPTRPIITSKLENVQIPSELIPTPKDLDQTVTLARKAQEIRAKIIATEKILNDIKAKSVIPGNDPKQFAEEFQAALNQLQKLTEEAREISHKLAMLSKTPDKPGKTKVLLKPPAKQLNIQLILTTTPNIINGIITDSQGNYLEGVIVVTHDKQGLPVRALKSNKLGQFLAATPLPNGTYTITFEKEDLIFDEIEIPLEGNPLPPIRVSAKKVLT